MRITLGRRVTGAVVAVGLVSVGLTSTRALGAPPSKAGPGPFAAQVLPSLALPTLPVPLPTLPPVTLPSLAPVAPLPTLPLPAPVSPVLGTTPPGPHGGIPAAAAAPVAATPVDAGNAAPAAALPDGTLGALLAASPALAASIDSILRRPVVLPEPDLRHFRLSASGPVPVQSPSQESGSAPSTVRRVISAPAVLLAIAIALSVGLLAALLQCSPALRRRLRAIGAGPRLQALAVSRVGAPLLRAWRRPLRAGRLAVPVGAAAVCLVATGTVFATAMVIAARPGAPVVTAPVAQAAPIVRTVTLPPAPVAAAPSSPSAPVNPPDQVAPATAAVAATAPAPAPAPAAVVPDAARQSAALLWTQLTTVEQTLAADADRLTADRAAVAQLSAVLSAPLPDLGPRGTVQAARTVVMLRDTVADSERLAAEYRQLLQTEDQIYRRAASDKDVAGGLLARALASGQPAIRDSVTYDLQIVETQLVQEQSVSAAEASAPNATLVPGGDGTFNTPMRGAVTQRFGPTDFTLEPAVTYAGIFYPHFHTGLDLAAPSGTPVTSAADGVVILAASSVDGAGHLVGYGNYVVIRHAGGDETLYGHLSQVLVRAGDVVRQGQPVGLEGSTGWSTGPHLHFEIRHNRIPVDPLPRLAAGAPSSAAPAP